VKYCMLTSCKLTTLVIEEPRRSGLYKWLDVFNSDAEIYRERMDLEAYDVIHINLSGGDLGFIPPVVEELENSSTQVVVSNDYSLEMWQNKIPYNPHMLVRALRGVDWFFGTEPMTANFLANLTKRKEVYTIPHPVDVKFLKSRPEKVEAERISILYHRYDNQILVPWMVTNDAGMDVWLLGYQGSRFDNHNAFTQTLFGGIKKHKKWVDHLNLIEGSKMVYEPTTYFTWSRSITECAALGKLAFGSDRGYAMKRCYPETCCDPYDTTGLRKIMFKLKSDKNFADEVREQALEQSEYYDVSKAKERFLACVDANQKTVS